MKTPILEQPTLGHRPLSEPMFERVALIGIGLIGSSIGHAARRANLASSIVGSARTAETVETAMRLGIIDNGYATAAEAAKGADLVILCVPVGRCGPLAAEIAPYLDKGAILTDVGSVKGAIVRDVAPHVPAGVHFVPGHPIAGTEQSGPESGFAELFDGRWCILTPEPAPIRRPWRAQDLLGALGSHVEIMDRRPPRLGARHHQPRASPDRLQHRQHRRALGARNGQRGDPVLGRRLPRFHPHRCLGPDDVARRLPQQQGSGAGDAGPLHRGPDDAAAGNPLRRRRPARDDIRRTRTIRRGIITAGQDTAAPDFGRVHPTKIAETTPAAPVKSTRSRKQ